MHSPLIRTNINLEDLLKPLDTGSFLKSIKTLTNQFLYHFPINELAYLQTGEFLTLSLGPSFLVISVIPIILFIWPRAKKRIFRFLQCVLRIKEKRKIRNEHAAPKGRILLMAIRPDQQLLMAISPDQHKSH